MMSYNEDRFIHEGRGLDHWLWELVCEDMDRRQRASDVLNRMHCDLEIAEVVTEAFLEEFGVAVRETLALHDYQEQDPDSQHYSEHERVVRALQHFGRASAPAIPALIERILREGE